MAKRTKGVKDDGGKLAYELIDDAAEAETVAVLTYGKEKYGAENWRDVEEAEERYFGALRRHFRESRGGIVIDAESGLMTLACAATDAHFLLALEIQKHPELVVSLPARLKEAVRRARILKAERLRKKRR